MPGIIRVRTNVLGILKRADQQAAHQDHDADVVEHQAEERVDVAPLGPARSRAGALCSRPPQDFTIEAPRNGIERD